MSKAEQQLNVVIGLAKPPYVVKEPLTGFEIELVNHVFEKMNTSANYIFVPFGRTPRMLKNEDIDAILTVNKQVMPDEQLLTDVYINYQNVAISLAKNNFEINSIRELEQFTLATFQNAHKILGEAFADTVQKSPLYSQVANQKIQLEMLFKERAEVIIMDINIFNHYLKSYEKNPLNQAFTVHEIFPPSAYRAAFKDTDNVMRFNKALATVLESDEYRALVSKYQIVREHKKQ
ncbi:substrate-binding periplasmic protein [Thalassotalea euphylliae]